VDALFLARAIAKPEAVGRQRGNLGSHAEIASQAEVFSDRGGEVAHLVELVCVHAGPGIPNRELRDAVKRLHAKIT
jgi:hypothetical protein